MTFTKFFRTLRTELGLTQQELAKRLGISQGALSKIEAGLLEPRGGVLIKALRMGWTRQNICDAWSDLLWGKG